MKDDNNTTKTQAPATTPTDTNQKPTAGDKTPKPDTQPATLAAQPQAPDKADFKTQANAEPKDVWSGRREYIADNPYTTAYENNMPDPRADKAYQEEARKAAKERALAAIGQGMTAIGKAIGATAFRAPQVPAEAKSEAQRLRDRWDIREREQRQAIENYIRGKAAAANLDVAWRQKRDAAKAQAAEDEKQYRIKVAEAAARIQGENAKANNYNAQAEYYKAKGVADIMGAQARINAAARNTKTQASGGRGAWSAVDSEGKIRDFNAGSTAQAYAYAKARGWEIYINPPETAERTEQTPIGETNIKYTRRKGDTPPGRLDNFSLPDFNVGSN